MNTFKLIDLIEGFHLIQGINFLHENHLYDELKSPKNAGQLAHDSSLDTEKLSALLWYIAARTDVIENLGNNCYKLNKKYRDYRKMGFWLDQYDSHDKRKRYE